MGKSGSDRHGSVWSDTSSVLKFGSLKKDIKTDVLIIGGGMAGILCAYMLGQAGVDYVLVEAETVCSGIGSSASPPLPGGRSCPLYRTGAVSSA